jgi:hypothetical protein
MAPALLLPVLKKRIPITFEDQKRLITHHQQEKYKEKHQIARTFLCILTNKK